MNIAMILAGGAGSRVGTRTPKQFIEVQGKPILVHTIEKFQDNRETDAILIVCIDSYQDKLKKLVNTFNLTKVKYIVSGGNTYQNSVINGLNALDGICRDDDIVSIHFGASPFVSNEIISDAIDVAYKNGNGISANPIVLCLAEKDPADNDRSSVIGRDRDRVMGLNSPQAFRFAFVRDMYREGAQKALLDSIDPHTTSLMAALGKRLYFSKGSSLNIKITTPEDIKLFNAYLMAGIDR